MFGDYAEVRNDYLDDADGFYRIDTWMTDDDNEEGKVVAYVHAKSGDAVICEPLAYGSRKVKEAIEELQREIRMEYQYKELFERATSENATQEDVNALGEWFRKYGNKSDWNGEVYITKTEDFPYNLKPIVKWDEESDCGEIVGYEFVL